MARGKSDVTRQESGESEAAFLVQNCPDCGKPLKIPAQYAGRFGACVHCGGTVLAEHRSTTRPVPAAVMAPSRRLSLDVLRGFDMFWIVGADSVCEALEKVWGGAAAPGFIQGITRQLRHVPWDGFVFYDLIFPLFLFIVGMSAVLSVSKIIARDGRRAALTRIARRSALLFLLGAISVLYNVKDAYFHGGLHELLRQNIVCGVLQRIALCYLATATLVCLVELRGVVAAFAVVFAGYWAALSLVPAPGETAVHFEHGRNILHYIDKHLPPYYDISSESLMTSIGAVCTCLLGALTAMALERANWDDTEQAKWLVAAGVAAFVVGCLWSYQMPIIKRLWTPSYIAVAFGFSLAMLGLFTWVIDALEWRIGVAPFLWLGSNSIVAYFFGGFMRPVEWVNGLTGGVSPGAEALLAVFRVGITLAFVGYLYRRRWFLRV